MMLDNQFPFTKVDSSKKYPTKIKIPTFKASYTDVTLTNKTHSGALFYVLF